MGRVSSFPLFIVVYFVAHVLAEGDNYVFLKNPQTVEVVAGKNITLECEVAPGDGIIYHWTLNGVPLGNTTRRRTLLLDGGGSSLYVARADREEDAGTFACVAQRVDGTGSPLVSNEAQINVLWIGEAKVQLQLPESASYIESGKEIILRCHLDGTGDIHVKWLRNMERIVDSDRVVMKKKRLHIKHVTAADNGIYKCIAENDAGTSISTSDFALAIPDEQSVVIQEIPKNQLVKIGDVVQMDCVYKNADVIQWFFKKNGPLENTERITVFPNGSISIKDIEKEDEGTYSCVGMRSESTEMTQTYTAELNIAYIEPLALNNFEPELSSSKQETVAEGDEFQITCLQPNGLPIPKVWWRSPKNHTISDSGSIRVDEGRLIVTEANDESVGSYTCVAENSAGISEMSFTLIVTKPPIVKEIHPKKVEVNESDSFELTCNYEGLKTEIPITIVQWRKNGKLLNDEKDTTGYRLQVFKNDRKLHVMSAVGSDQGQYQCEVITSKQSPVLSTPAMVIVKEKLKFSPPPVNKRLELGSTAKIHCKAQGGGGNPVVKWIKLIHSKKSKDGKAIEINENIDSNESLPVHVSDINGTLLFNSVQFDDAGNYSCVAKDGDEVINVTIKLDVVVAPKFNVIPLNPTEAIEGTSAMIHCMVDGDPKPTIYWDKNLKMNDFDHSRFQVLENGSLFIKEVHLEDENNYGCTAGNSAGLNRKEARLIVKTGEGFRANGDIDPESEGAMITKAVLITTSVAAAYMILVVGLMLWCRYRRKARKLGNAEEGKNETEEITKDNQETTKEVVDTTSGPSEQQSIKSKKPHSQTNGDTQKSDSADTAYSHSSGNSKKSKSNYDKLQINRDCLTDMLLIGRGEFGEIMVGKLMATSGKRNSSVPEEPTEPQSVLIKSLTESKDENALSEFKRQIDLFSKTSHENVAKLMGLSREAEPHYILLEYTDWGDLKRFLVATSKESMDKNTSNPGPPPLSVTQVVSVALQLARGMEHIADLRLVHKDLAARNCLISSTICAKISLSAITKDVYREEYCKHVNSVIPLRWLPFEAVYEDDYSTKSDVWSWSCTIWELFHQGALPFSDLSDTVVLAQLKSHSLDWSPHKATPPELAELQKSCWTENPAGRPTFTTVVQKLTEIMNSL